MRYLAPFLAIMAFLAPACAEVSAPAPNLTVEIYTIPGCMGCGMAKSLLEDRGIRYREISIKGRPDLYAEMKRRAGGDPEESMTVPRVFINGDYIGGYSDLSNFDFDAPVIKGRKAGSD